MAWNARPPFPSHSRTNLTPLFLAAAPSPLAPLGICICTLFFPPSPSPDNLSHALCWLQEEKFKFYHNQLSHLVKEYESVVGRVQVGV